MFIQVYPRQMTFIWKYFVLVIEFCRRETNDEAGISLNRHCG